MALESSAEGRAYDAVLMDMNMPVMDGYDATRELVAKNVEAPIIALTALALAGDEERCREAGCVGYISKPVVPSRFLDTISQHLTPSSASQPSEAPAEDEDDGLLLSLADNPRFRPLIDRYVASFAGLLIELRQHFDGDDLHQVRTRVHRVRGTASNYGFPEISRAAGRCEDLIRSAAARDRIDVALGDLEELLRAAQDATRPSR